MQPAKGRKGKQDKNIASAPQELASKWSLAWSVIQSDPELSSWFTKWAQAYTDSQGKISKERFFLDLEQQPFWQKHSAQYIQDLDFELRYPQVYQREVEASADTVMDQASALGAVLTRQQALDIAKQVRRSGLNQAQQRNLLASYVTAVNGDFMGAAGVDEEELRQWSLRNGLGLSDQAIADSVRKIAAGDMTVDDAKSMYRKMYMTGAYPAWAEQIGAGMDIADIAAPYRQSMGKLLEQDGNQIGLDDPLMRQGLQGVGGDGKPRVVPLWEFEQSVRKDPRWQKTDNAYQTYTSVAQNLLQMFGFR